MTARIDLAKLEQMLSQRASDEKCIMDAQWCDNYRDSARARDRLAEADNAMRNAMPALIAAVRALREIVARVDVDIASGIEFEQSSDDAALEKRARAALAAFDFKEETK